MVIAPGCARVLAQCQPPFAAFLFQPFGQSLLIRRFEQRRINAAILRQGKKNTQPPDLLPVFQVPANIVKIRAVYAFRLFLLYFLFQRPSCSEYQSFGNKRRDGPNKNVSRYSPDNKSNNYGDAM
ncbi:MAG: hypothetical protein LBD47_07635 [Treponema sp.]|jgi:hypothetical protein|nr:hypothetical protein [Treponema sp.]